MRRSIQILFSVKRALARIVSAAAVCMGIACFDVNPAAGEERTVAMGDNFFSPRNLTIQPGDTVNWVNQGNNLHTTTSDAGLWDSGVIQKSATFSRTFNDLGSFPYFCTVHGHSMSGTITVDTNGVTETRELFLLKVTAKCLTTND